MNDIARAIETLKKISDIETSKNYAELHEIKTLNYDLVTAINVLNDTENTWISVKDRVPLSSQEALCSVIIPEYGGKFKRSNKVLQYFDYERRWICEGMIVTHWQPLPQPPKEGNENA